MPLALEDVAIAFQNCNGEAKWSLKEYLKSLDKNKQQYETGFVVDKAYNYILTDIECLLSKAILNICAADLLIKNGFFSWGFVTSYYANFFLAQSINRLYLNFFTWINSSVICSYSNYIEQELKVQAYNKSSDTHQREFQTFFENSRIFREQKGIDRYWNIGIRQFDMANSKGESGLRNFINYEITSESFDELNLDENKFNQIVRTNQTSPFNSPKEQASQYKNYARNNIKLAISRLRVSTYILNFLAVKNLEYRSYFERKMKMRIQAIESKYPHLSDWILDFFKSWLVFNSELITESDVIQL
ncbi:hypothetical protein FEK30_12770 [Picosynechococcus sp. PCC 11901]|uniref:hypothetical protein n=1 Tax=Picosynechococcus sp. PCC 11901 TaxID=2579791 RepID=UPI0010FC15A4|nr:hypothetical protein [Picosynechococcus sp. PCC 11901]QCS50225.1 hypothetical protein FEK30_12770 [Picosynechococcus sp. PCC 11901]